jgi:superfamily II DNA/RNA helicase
MAKPVDRFEEVAPTWLLEALSRPPLAYTAPLPIQRVVIPQVCCALASGIHFDICLSAPTGAGKTLCYLLPMLRHISIMKKTFGDTQFRGIVLVPTKALGHQVTSIATALGAAQGIEVALCCGDDRDSTTLTRTVTLPDGTRRTYAAADVIVATPQKLMKQLLLNQPGYRKLPQPPAEEPTTAADRKAQGTSAGAYDDDEDEGVEGNRLLRYVEMLVVDEADELLTGTFTNFACRIASAIDEAAAQSGFDRPVHKMLCSATLTSRIANISELRLHNAKAYALDAEGVNDEAAASGGYDASSGQRLRSTLALPKGLHEHTVIVRQEEKRHAVLLRVIRHILDTITASIVAPAADAETPAADGEKVKGYRTVLVFAGSTDQARVLCHFLTHAGHRALEFTTAASETERRQAVLEAYAGSDCIVVATDALMRGIDLPGVTAVVMYDAPRTLQQYVHRIGRTARAGKSGHSFVLLSREGISGKQEDGEVAVFKSFDPYLKRTNVIWAHLDLRNVDDLLADADKYLALAKEGLERGWATAADARVATTDKHGRKAAVATAKRPRS